jgi:hypothetical protein
MHQNLFINTPKNPRLIAVAIFYNFFLHDPDNFPGFGYDQDEESCTYFDGCAVGCLLPQQVTKALDVRDPDGDMVGQCVNRLPIDILRRFGLKPQPTVYGELAFPPNDVDTIGFLITCQKIHDECADLYYTTHSGPDKVPTQFKSRLLSLFEARYGHSTHDMAPFRDRVTARRLLADYLNPEIP